MKVKVRAITVPYLDVPTKSLQAILRNHAYGKLHVQISTQQLFSIMDELARRRELSESPFKSNEDAWAEFVRHYLPKEEDEAAETRQYRRRSQRRRRATLCP